MSAEPCSRCAGASWVQVGEKYAEHLATKAVDREKDPAEWAARRAAYLNSYYPCPTCNRAMFFRWQGGHLDRDHVRAGCPECIDAGAAKRGTRRHAMAASSGPPPPSEPPEGWDDLAEPEPPAPPPTLYDERKDLE